MYEYTQINQTVQLLHLNNLKKWHSYKLTQSKVQ